MTTLSTVTVLEVDHFPSLSLGGDWRVITVDTGRAAVAALSDGIAMVLVGANHDAPAIVAAIRGSGRAEAALPIIMMGEEGGLATEGLAAVDAFVTGHGSAELSNVLATWRPVELPEAYARLEATFGAAAVHGMARRLVDVLADALDALGTPAAAGEAHRVAGVAGTLGFADLGRQWLELSHHPGSHAPTLRRDTRRTIAAILLRLREAD